MIITNVELVEDQFGTKAQFQGTIAVDAANQPIGITEEQFYADLGKELVRQVKAKLGE
jgi:hypothetical protein